jgi:hypothetical protein
LAPFQQYSLVVLGGFANTIYDDFNPAVVPQPQPLPGDGGNGNSGGYYNSPPADYGGGSFFSPSPDFFGGGSYSSPQNFFG